MHKIKPLFLGLLALLAFSTVGAQDKAPAYDAHGLLIYNVWVRPTAGELAEGATPEPPIPGTTTAVYMTLQNTSETAYQLVSIETDAAEMTHVHETTLEGDVARMRMIRAVEIPAGETVSLAPLGFHAMLMNTTRDVRPGEAVALRLTFADVNGDTFDVPIAAYATDFPPEVETFVIANLRATNHDDVLIVGAFISDYYEEFDGYPTLTSHLGATITALPMPLPRSGSPVLDRMSLFAANVTPSEQFWEENSVLPAAFTVTLTFESGKTLTVAVPVIGAAS